MSISLPIHLDHLFSLLLRPVLGSGQVQHSGGGRVPGLGQAGAMRIQDWDLHGTLSLGAPVVPGSCSCTDPVQGMGRGT